MKIPPIYTITSEMIDLIAKINANLIYLSSLELPELIKEKIASLCNIEPSQVGLTVTSGEELTPFGKGEAIQVFSIVSLRKENAA